MKLYRTTNGAVVLNNNLCYTLLKTDWNALINDDDLHQSLLALMNGSMAKPFWHPLTDKKFGRRALLIYAAKPPEWKKPKAQVVARFMTVCMRPSGLRFFLKPQPAAPWVRAERYGFAEIRLGTYQNPNSRFWLRPIKKLWAIPLATT
jgi:hypothetical protein